MRGVNRYQENVAADCVVADVGQQASNHISAARHMRRNMNRQFGRECNQTGQQTRNGQTLLRAMGEDVWHRLYIMSALALNAAISFGAA